MTCLIDYNLIVHYECTLNWYTNMTAFNVQLHSYAYVICHLIGKQTLYVMLSTNDADITLDNLLMSTCIRHRPRPKVYNTLLSIPNQYQIYFFFSKIGVNSWGYWILAKKPRITGVRVLQRRVLQRSDCKCF